MSEATSLAAAATTATATIVQAAETAATTTVKAAETSAIAAAKASETASQGFLRRNVWVLVGIVVVLAAGIAAYVLL